ncbi:MAG: glycosyltransferase [Flavobacteriia bacterium]|nr:glycosyltransferase [Flavobacteriia bacterium]
MIKKAIKFIRKKKPSYNLESIKKQIKEIRMVSDYVVVCPQPTGMNWKGVNIATLNLFGNNVVELPQFYSDQVISDHDIKSLCLFILKMDFRMIVLSGFPCWYEVFINQFENKNIHIGVWFHGTLSEMENSENNSIKKIIHLLEIKKINLLGVVREDLIPFFESFSSGNIKALIPYTPIIAHNAFQLKTMRDVKIGVFGLNSFNKNIYNQVAAALMIVDSLVYVTDLNIKKVFNNDRIIYIGTNLSKNEFLEFLKNMSINLHCSFSESWGQITTESLMLGIPCLVSSNTNIFKHDEILKNNLVVEVTDSPIRIKEKILYTLNNLETKRYISYVFKLNELSVKYRNEFINTAVN